MFHDKVLNQTNCRKRRLGKLKMKINRISQKKAAFLDKKKLRKNMEEIDPELTYSGDVEIRP